MTPVAGSFQRTRCKRLAASGVPGAMPGLMGYTAVSGSVDAVSLCLFGVAFFVAVATILLTVRRLLREVSSAMTEGTATMARKTTKPMSGPRHRLTVRSPGTTASVLGGIAGSESVSRNPAAIGVVKSHRTIYGGTEGMSLALSLAAAVLAARINFARGYLKRGLKVIEGFIDELETL